MNEDIAATIEISGARPGELDTVLEVMCEAFELPFEVARPIFYNDPYFDPENKRVLRVAGRVVSCLTITESEYWIGRGAVKIAGIAGLSTRLEARRQGYAARLLQATLDTLEERGYVLTGLYPYDYAYYRRMGWETAGQGYRLTTSPACLPRFPQAAHISTSANPSDLPEVMQAVQPALDEHQPSIAALYAANAAHQTLHGLRDAKRWRYLQERVPIRLAYTNAAGQVEGYMLAESRAGTVQIGTEQAQTPPALRVMEFCASTSDAQRGLVGYLAAQTQFGQIEYEAALAQIGVSGLISAAPEAEECAPPRIERAEGVMLRVLHFPRLLAALRPNWNDFNGAVALVFFDERPFSVAITVTVVGNGQGLPEVVALSDVPLTDFWNSTDSFPDYIVGDMRVWAQAATGHISGEDACALGLLRASTSESAKIAAELFPHRAPFLPPPDHF